MALNLSVLCLLYFITQLLVARGAEKDVCFVGYIMDSYCIDRETLLDKPSLVSRENPDRHSVHCLVDIGVCRTSEYHLLRDPESGDADEDTYCTAFVLDSNGRDLVIEHARDLGDCDTCDSSGELVQGYRATITGTVSGGGVAPTLRVTSVQAADVGCPGGATTVAEKDLDCSSGSDINWIITHASLMIISWGFLLPLGVVCARVFKHLTPADAWFKWHRRLQITGLLVALTGWAIALYRFKALDTGPGGPSYPHAAMGCTVMALGILQPINAYFRPHKPSPVDKEEGKEDEEKEEKEKKGEERQEAGLEGQQQQQEQEEQQKIQQEANSPASSTLRVVWEYYHKGSGYLALVLALITIVLGLNLLPPELMIIFSSLWYCLLACLVLLVCYMCYDRGRSSRMRSADSSAVLTAAAAADDEFDEKKVKDVDVANMGTESLAAAPSATTVGPVVDDSSNKAGYELVPSHGEA